jgi:tripartite-type tricarboxylate transporter receptor subunit TctC
LPERSSASRSSQEVESQGGTWFGLAAPTGTPAEAIVWVNRETQKAFSVPAVRERFLSQGTLTPAEFSAHIAAEREKWGEVIRRAHIRLE